MLTKSEFAAFLAEDELKQYKPLPQTQLEALDALEQDRKWAESALGKDLLFWHLSNRRHEAEVFSKMSELERKVYLAQYF